MRALRIGINARVLARPESGVGHYLAELLGAIAGIDTPHHFFLYTDSAPDCRFPADRFRVVEAMPAGTPPSRFDRHFTDSPAFAAERPDLLFVPYLARPAHCHGMPVVHTVHDLVPIRMLAADWLWRGRTPWKQLSLAGLVARFRDPGIARRAAGLVTGSAASRDDIVRFLGVPADRIRLVPYGLAGDLRRTPGVRPTVPAPATCRARHGLDRPFVINCGGLVVRKNLGRQVEAFLSLPAARSGALQLLVTGEGYWKRKLEKRFASDPRVRFSGTLPREELLALLGAARFSCYASLYEGFGFPVLESLAVGTPVVTSDNSSLAELLPELTLRADPCDTGAIAAAMARALQDGDGWRERIAAAWPAIAAYDWEACARAHLALWAAAAGRIAATGANP